jgi:hypothetical protein
MQTTTLTKAKKKKLRQIFFLSVQGGDATDSQKQ